MSALPTPRSSSRSTASRGGARPGRARAHSHRPQLRIVGPARHHRRWIALLAVLSATGVIGVVALNAMAAEYAFTARELESEVARYSVRYTELVAEVAALESPGRVRAVAISELGMVPAEQPGFLWIGRAIAEDTAPRSDVATLEGVDSLEAGAVADPVKAALGAGP